MYEEGLLVMRTGIDDPISEAVVGSLRLGALFGWGRLQWVVRSSFSLGWRMLWNQRARLDLRDRGEYLLRRPSKSARE